MQPLTNEQRDQLSAEMESIHFVARSAAQKYGKHLYDDALSSAMYGAVKATGSYRPDGGASLATHLRARAQGQIVDDLRAQERHYGRKVHDSGVSVKLLARNDDGTLTVDARDSFEKWLKIAASGNPETEFILRCLYLSGLTVKETAKAIDCSEFTVFNRLRDARARAADYVQKQPAQTGVL